jgi:methylated-DNA-[protein]-cysteine S-methyltransferase
MNRYSKIISSPIGDIQIVTDQRSLVSVDFIDSTRDTKVLNDYLVDDYPTILLDTEKQLHEYFEGKRKIFNLKLELKGTEFQMKAWEALQTIKFGQTISYQKQAELIGNIKAVRAVAGANNRNPIAIVVPCHRVIGKNNTLTGYGGGIWRKEWLLKHEGVKG